MSEGELLNDHQSLVRKLLKEKRQELEIEELMARWLTRRTLAGEKKMEYALGMRQSGIRELKTFIDFLEEIKDEKE